MAAGTLGSFSFADRVAAAAAANFQGIGLSVDQYDALRDSGWTDAAIRSLLEQHGIRILEAEAIFGFDRTGHPDHPLLGGRTYSDPHTEDTAFAIADALEVQTIQAVGALEGHADAATIDAFAALCDRAVGHGARVALEFIPATCIPDPATAVSIVQAAGRSNGGICSDSWHFFRGEANSAQLRAIPPESLFVIQLDDGPHRPERADYFEDTIAGRCLPGHGAFDLPTFLGALLPLARDTHVSVEILSDRLDGANAFEAAAHAARATTAVLERAAAAIAST